MEELPRRLDKFVREASRLSLVEVRSALSTGRIECPRLGPAGTALDGKALIFSDDVVLFRGRRLEQPREHTTIVFNKPRSVTSTTRDPRGKRDLSAYAKHMPQGLFPVGRLDRETTGALLFTTDGDLASAVLRPDHELEKEYWLWLDESLSADDPRLSRWTEGMKILGAWAKAARVSLLSATADTSELLVFLREGKNRQIRRMCRALDLRLLHLHRRAIGPVRVDDLQLGSHRTLEPGEVEDLYRAAGGRSEIVERKRAALERMARSLRIEGRPNMRLEEWLDRHGPTRTAASRSVGEACTPPGSQSRNSGSCAAVSPTRVQEEPA